MSRRPAVFLLLLLAAALPAAASQKPKTSRPGQGAGGVTLLPNGWRIAPAGRHITVGDLPLAMAESPDGRTLVISNDGYSKPTLSLVDLKTLDVRQKVVVANTWLGALWHPDGKRLYLSGGGANTVEEFRLTAKGLEAGRSIKLEKPTDASFVGGLAISPDGSRLFAVHALGQLLSAVDLRTGEV
ncbi:MAG: YncE family protein, partial [Thermoanaerobaculia bacterium]